MEDERIEKQSLIQIIECGYRYVCPSPIVKGDFGTDSSTRANLSKWICDRKGCNAWIIDHAFPNDYSFIELKGNHNHPPYPDSYKWDVPYPYIPGKRYPYKLLKLMCDCKRGTIDPEDENFVTHLEGIYDMELTRIRQEEEAHNPN